MKGMNNKMSSLKRKDSENDANPKENQSDENALFKSILESSPQIKIATLKPDGDFVFSAQIADFGINPEDFEKTPIAQTVFFANFIGELLVRRNLQDFVTLLDQLDQKTYDQMINNYQHKHFGMRRNPEDGSIRFVFHSSLIQDILTEDMVNLFCI